ncbi:MAG: hypothetical protein LH468_03115 [Nocardioides sp.]|nr:hypothetical protein [Nocardioides sp.]
MRTSITAGLLLVVAAPLLVGLSSWADLELEPVVLIGTALGAVAALVPDRTPGVRLLACMIGVAVGLVGYVVRAGFLPDTPTGRAAAVAITLAVCVILTAATRERLALWAVLLGAGGFAGAFEATFSAAPTEVLSSSISTATSFVVTVAVGFLVCSAVGPGRHGARTTTDHRVGDHDNLVLEKNA